MKEDMDDRWESVREGVHDRSLGQEGSHNCCIVAVEEACDQAWADMREDSREIVMRIEGGLQAVEYIWGLRMVKVDHDG